jgi:hypothetical protein
LEVSVARSATLGQGETVIVQGSHHELCHLMTILRRHNRSVTLLVQRSEPTNVSWELETSLPTPVDPSSGVGSFAEMLEVPSLGMGDSICIWQIEPRIRLGGNCPKFLHESAERERF